MGVLTYFQKLCIRLLFMDHGCADDWFVWNSYIIFGIQVGRPFGDMAGKLKTILKKRPMPKGMKYWYIYIQIFCIMFGVVKHWKCYFLTIFLSVYFFILSYIFCRLHFLPFHFSHRSSFFNFSQDLHQMFLSNGLT